MSTATKTSNKKRRDHQPATGAPSNLLHDHRDGVAWLALFLTNDELLADACVVDTLTETSTLIEAYEDQTGRY